LHEQEGSIVTSVWTDIQPLHDVSAERLGYPTQKPLALLERIIAASSNEGDLVLDPFCGCGTAIAAAQKLKRKWIGIDITHLSIALQKNRLKDMFDLKPGKDYRVIGEPQDLGSARQLAHDNRYQFQWWALSLVQARPLGGAGQTGQPHRVAPTEGDVGATLRGRPVGGHPEGRKGADRGIDGVITFIDDPRAKPKRALVQVKSGHVKSGDVRDLRGTVEREDATVGIFITLEPVTREMEKEAVAAGFYHSPLVKRDYPKLQVLTIEDLLNGAEPKLPIVRGTFKQAERVKDADGKQRKMEL
jgi:site-specific DNA-methyltransferase (adenine-specific)